MLKLPTVLLRHTTETQTHLDWLMGFPAEDDRCESGRLWTGRVKLPPSSWPRLRTWLACELPPHRRFYLTHQGPIPGPAFRGVVMRVAQGSVLPRLWRSGRRVLELDLPALGLRGVVAMQRLDALRWRAIWLGDRP